MTGVQTCALPISTSKIIGYGLLRFDGADAQSFLQGQLTSDVKAPAVGEHQYTGYCTAKGRLLMTGLLWRTAGGYGLMLPLELCEPMRKRLAMYILRAKVKATDVTADFTLLCAMGDAPDIAGATVLKLSGTRHLIIAPATAHAATDEAAPWARLDIEAGIPMITLATQEQFVPQSVNLDRIGAVNFNKGCYPGQEIVARTHYLGKVKQRMVRAFIASDNTIAPGDKLYAPEFGDQASGMIVNAVPAGGGAEVLAVVHTASLANGDIRCQTKDGPKLTVGALPYAMD